MEMIVKNVDVMGDTIMAAQDSAGVIWVGIKWMCQGMGMSEGQWKRQITNIQKDLLLKKAGSNLILPTSGGEKDVFCLKNDYLPIWLAKISITPSIQKNNPDLADKLLEYQLKAKDILAAAFMPKQSGAPKTIPEQIKLLAQGNVELNQRVDGLEKETYYNKEEIQSVKHQLDEFKETLPLLPEDADEISGTLKKRGVEILGGKQSTAYNDRSLRMKLYRNFYSNLKYNFGSVGTYKAIKRNQKADALKVITEYKPPLFLQEQIDKANAKQGLET